MRLSVSSVALNEKQNEKVRKYTVLLRFGRINRKSCLYLGLGCIFAGDTKQNPKLPSRCLGWFLLIHIH